MTTKVLKEEMVKVSHQKDFKLEYQGRHWVVDMAEWQMPTPCGTRGELRIYKIYGDITDPMLYEALQMEADLRGFDLITAERTRVA